MFDYYKAWDKFTADATGEEDEDGEIILAKNPEAENDKGPMS